MNFKRMVLTPAPGLPAAIGYYLCAMEEVREQLRDAVSSLSNEQLARRAVAGAHSIGALVLHIGEAEWWWMRCVISGHQMTDEDRRQPYWDVLVHPNEFSDKGYSAQFCLDVIAELRSQTHDILASSRMKTLTASTVTREASEQWK